MNSFEQMSNGDTAPDTIRGAVHKTPDRCPATAEESATQIFPDTHAQPRRRLPVIMSIHAEQDLNSDEPDEMELLTEGFMELDESGLALQYEESSLTGMEGTTTVLEVNGTQVILRRSGTICSQMIFEQGRQHTSFYETPFGELSIDVQTSYLHHSLGEQGGQMEIHYSVSIEHASTGQNRFLLNVRRKQ